MAAHPCAAYRSPRNCIFNRLSNSKNHKKLGVASNAKIAHTVVNNYRFAQRDGTLRQSSAPGAFRRSSVDENRLRPGLQPDAFRVFALLPAMPLLEIMRPPRHRCSMEKNAERHSGCIAAVRQSHGRMVSPFGTALIQTHYSPDYEEFATRQPDSWHPRFCLCRPL